MPDREKLLRGLECCLTDGRASCEECYQKGPGFGIACRQGLMQDALELLKEQKPVNVHMYRKMFADIRSGYCPICNNPVDEEEDNNFCCKCGRRLNWDD